MSLNGTRSAKIAQGYEREMLASVKEAVDLRLSPTCRKILFGGSYGRECDLCRDLDVAIVPTRDTAALTAFLQMGQVIQAGPKSARIQVDLYPGAVVQVDLWLFRPEEWGCGSMFVMGSKQLNIRQRRQALAQGFSLNQYCLTDIRTGQRLEFRTEKGVYQFLNWEWLPYAKRNIA